MRILHISLASYYVEGMFYQENNLVRHQIEDDHEITVITSVFYWENGEIVRGEPCDRPSEYGIRLIRLPYTNRVSDFFHQKFRRVKGLYSLLEKISPDIILSHDLSYWSVLDVVRYKKNHPEVKFYADTHTDHYTSATNWLSLHVLHRIYYRYLVQKTLPYLEKYFYISDECRRFSLKNYGVPESLMEFYPLGGTILSEEEYKAARAERRAELGLAENTPLFVHAGKLEANKRTEALLRAFAAVPELNARLAIIGSIPEERKPLLTALMEADKRVVYLGWKSGEELQEYLCACDLYCQPGKVSAIMQNAVCCRCPILLYPHSGYVKDYDWGNICWVKTEEDLVDAFRALADGKFPLADMAENSARCARELLDYRALAARLYR